MIGYFESLNPTDILKLVIRAIDSRTLLTYLLYIFWAFESNVLIEISSTVAALVVNDGRMKSNDTTNTWCIYCMPVYEIKNRCLHTFIKQIFQLTAFLILFVTSPDEYLLPK